MFYLNIHSLNFATPNQERDPESGVNENQLPAPASLSIKAGVAKLVDVSDLGSDAARHGGSSPSTRTL